MFCRQWILDRLAESYPTPGLAWPVFNKVCLGPMLLFTGLVFLIRRRPTLLGVYSALPVASAVSAAITLEIVCRPGYVEDLLDRVQQEYGVSICGPTTEDLHLAPYLRAQCLTRTHY